MTETLTRETMTGGAGEALWNPQAHMPTARAKRLVITGGDGAWLTTSTGQRLLDATASLWHANVGHGRERIARAAYDQMRKLETYHTFGRFANEPALRLADRLAALGPIRGAKVMLTSGGSDSVDLACKLARRHWQLDGRGQKKVILSRHCAYHGLHAFGTSIAGLQYNRDGYGTEVADRFFAGPPDGDAPMFRHGLTYSGHATACVVAEANLDVIEEEDLVERAAHLETVLEKTVDPLRTHHLVADVRAGAAFMAGVQLRDDVSGDAVAEACTEAGVLIRTIHNNTLQICPPFVTTEDEVALIAQTIAQALDTYPA